MTAVFGPEGCFTTIELEAMDSDKVETDMMDGVFDEEVWTSALGSCTDHTDASSSEYSDEGDVRTIQLRHPDMLGMDFLEFDLMLDVDFSDMDETEEILPCLPYQVEVVQKPTEKLS